MTDMAGDYSIEVAIRTGFTVSFMDCDIKEDNFCVHC